jgi:hypothetical protein
MPGAESVQTDVGWGRRWWRAILATATAVAAALGLSFLLTRATAITLLVSGTLLVAYVLLAYLLLPGLWRHYEHHQALAAAPKTTRTADGIPGDPLNLALVGSEKEVIHAMLTAGWHPADPITLRTSLHLAESVLLRRNYVTAPVSSLYLWNRKQDLAFERLAAKSPSQRHHVRFWKSSELSSEERPLWIGAATFDQSVGLSHLTGQVTHHIAPDVDAERDTVIDDLQQAGQLVRLAQVTGVGATFRGRNGGGDWYYTDGELTIGTLAAENEVQTTLPEKSPNPTAVHWKNRVWAWLHGWLR